MIDYMKHNKPVLNDFLQERDIKIEELEKTIQEQDKRIEELEEVIRTHPIDKEPEKSFKEELIDLIKLLRSRRIRHRAIDTFITQLEL